MLPNLHRTHINMGDSNHFNEKPPSNINKIIPTVSGFTFSCNKRLRRLAFSNLQFLFWKFGGFANHPRLEIARTVSCLGFIEFRVCWWLGWKREDQGDDKHILNWWVWKDTSCIWRYLYLNLERLPEFMWLGCDLLFLVRFKFIPWIFSCFNEGHTYTVTQMIPLAYDCGWIEMGAHTWDVHVMMSFTKCTKHL